MRMVVSFSFTRDAGNPGFCDVGMAYAVGLSRLGHEVFVFEDVDAEACFDDDYARVSFESWAGRERFEIVTRSYGLWPRCALIYDAGRATHGMSMLEVRQMATSADLLMAISTRVRTPELLQASVRAYVDLNPAKTQVYHAEHGVDYGFAHFQHFFSVGLNVGTDRCELPTSGLRWTGVLPPVVQGLWGSAIDPTCERFTTISTWGPRHTFHYRGRYAGTKSEQWEEFVGLPRLTGQPLEIALATKPGHESGRRIFEQNGWTVTDASLLRDLSGYRGFIAGSRAELSVAHYRYVAFDTGWFSDRTARYLSCGKPALVQRTGVEGHLPTGKGLLTFATLDEAVEGVRAINANYLDHCRAARAIAEMYLDSDIVLSDMLERMGL